MQHKRPESVLVIVYTQNSQVLMLRRKYPHDFWQSVTGSLEWGEGADEAASRELEEETGLVEQNIQDCEFSQDFEIYPIWRDRYAPGVTQNKEHVYRLQLADVQDIQLDPKEHSEYQWLPREQAIELAFSPSNQQAIERWVPNAD